MYIFCGSNCRSQRLSLDEAKTLTNIKFPAVIDSWCEDSLSHPEGYWTLYAGQYVDIDRSVFAVGGSSIKTWSDQYWYYVASAFIINSDHIFNATRSNTRLHFLIALQSGRMSGYCTLTLFDVNDKRRYKNFTVNTVGVWEAKDFAMSDIADEPSDADFDWAHIARIELAAWQNYGSAGAFWVDQLYFSYDVPDSSLIITSSPTGKNGTYIDDLYGSQPFTTPSEITRPVGQIGTIQIDIVNFDHWQDDPQNINPTRQFTFAPTNTTLLAVYVIQQNPLLVIDSFDQNMNAVSGTSAVKLVYGGTPQFVNVPFAARVSKGLFSFVAQDVTKRTFDHWILPDNTTSTERTVTWDVQGDTRIEVHWQVTGNGGKGGINPLLLVGAVAVIGVVGVYFLTKK
jgi:hypothetical protein